MINRIAFKKRPTASLKMRHSENEKKLIVFSSFKYYSYICCKY
nr:MAG TPA: hypothetical protein [Crassvirales sp.]